MKNIIYILLLFPSMLFSQNWQWAKRIGSNYEVAGAPIFADINNNIYASGNYKYNSYFQSDTLTSNGYNDMFIVKYDQSGNEVWIKNLEEIIPLILTKE